MSTRTLDIRKIERIRLTEAQLEAEQQAKKITGNTHLTDEQFRELVSKGIDIIQAPEKAPGKVGT